MKISSDLTLSRKFFIGALIGPPLIFLVFLLKQYRWHIVRSQADLTDVIQTSLHNEVVAGLPLIVFWFCLFVAVLTHPAFVSYVRERTVVQPPSPLDGFCVAWYLAAFIGPLLGWILAGYFSLYSLTLDNWHWRLTVRIILGGATPVLLTVAPMAYAGRTFHLGTLVMIVFVMAVPVLTSISTTRDLLHGPRTADSFLVRQVPLGNHKSLLFLGDDRVLRYDTDRFGPLNHGDKIRITSLDGLRVVLDARKL